MQDVSVKRAAELLGWDINYLRIGLRHGIYPFGVASKAEKASRYSYKIYPKALQNFIYEKYGKEVTV